MEKPFSADSFLERQKLSNYDFRSKIQEKIMRENCVTKILNGLTNMKNWSVGFGAKAKFRDKIKMSLIYSCTHCEKMYSHAQSLHTHVKKMHPESEKSAFMCAQCPKRFDNEKKLKVHEQVHLPDEKKFTVNCPFCDKKFTKNVNVQAHIRSIHQQERPFLCSDCGKDFSTKGALKEHQIIHSDTYPFQCAFWWAF